MWLLLSLAVRGGVFLLGVIVMLALYGWVTSGLEVIACVVLPLSCALWAGELWDGELEWGDHRLVSKEACVVDNAGSPEHSLNETGFSALLKTPELAGNVEPEGETLEREAEGRQSLPTAPALFL